ncbi:hypothetical protein [Dyella sp. C9]|uniref:hypothetical protein n=1 Tax=Dyella sp. C9 TaxID=2202154 RepID=UPI0013004C1A|nr:hypothetical protein [Dyella sp. C9]
MLLKIACLVALLCAPLIAAAAGAVPSGPCRLIDPTTCSTTSDLARASGFTEALGHFASGTKASYFRSNRSLSEQLLSGLGGAAESVQALPDKNYLFAGCLSRDCGGIASAVIVNEYGQILAIGFSSFHCDSICDDQRYLDFYFRKDTQDDALVAALKSWGTSDKLHKSLIHPEADDNIEKRIDVHIIP